MSYVTNPSVVSLTLDLVVYVDFGHFLCKKPIELWGRLIEFIGNLHVLKRLYFLFFKKKTRNIT